MKSKTLGLLLVLATMALALPASAEVSVGPDAGVFIGTATVGKNGACDNTGGNVEGGGLGLIPDVDPVSTPKLAWFTISAPAPAVTSLTYGAGGLELCGKLSGPVGPPVSNAIGASCAATKGWDGEGLAFFDRPEPLEDVEIWIEDLGWKATLGGTFLVSGQVGGEKGKAADLLLAQVQALDDEVVIGCINKTGGDKDTSQVFLVEAAYEIVPLLGGLAPAPKVEEKKDPKGKD